MKDQQMRQQSINNIKRKGEIMLEKEEFEALEDLFKRGLITKKMRDVVAGANNFDETMFIIIRLMTEKMIMMRYERATEIERIVREAVVSRHVLAVTKAGEMGKLLDCWKNFLEAAEIFKEYEVSVILDYATYKMISEFFNSPKVLTVEGFTSVQPKIVNIFVPEEDYARNKIILEKYDEILSLKQTCDKQEFIKRAAGTIVVCSKIDSRDTDAIELVCMLLEKGIFVAAEGSGKMDLKTFDALREAIQESPLLDGQGAIHLKNGLYTKPFNPDISIDDGSCNCESEHGVRVIRPESMGDLSETIIRSMMGL